MRSAPLQTAPHRTDRDTLHTDKPEAPQRVRVSELNGKHCRVHWEAPQNTGGCEVSYAIELKDLSRRSAEQLGTTNDTSFSVDSLQVGKNYAFAVAACNEVEIAKPIINRSRTIHYSSSAFAVSIHNTSYFTRAIS